MAIFKISISQVHSILRSILKKRVFSSDDSDFRTLQNIFCSFPWHKTCVCKILYDHIYLPKQTAWSYGASIRFYGWKWKQMVILGNSYSLSIAQLTIRSRFLGTSPSLKPVYSGLEWFSQVLNICIVFSDQNLPWKELGLQWKHVKVTLRGEKKK